MKESEVISLWSHNVISAVNNVVKLVKKSVVPVVLWRLLSESCLEKNIVCTTVKLKMPVSGQASHLS